MSEWDSITAADVRVGDLISWSMNKPHRDHGYHYGIVLKIAQENGCKRIIFTCNDGVHVYYPDSQLWRKAMAKDEHGMPVPSDESPLPWKWVDTLTATGSEIHADNEFVDGPVGEIYVSDDNDRFVKHAVNNIIECRNIVRRLAEYYESYGLPLILGEDADRLWAKMKEESEGQK